MKDAFMGMKAACEEAVTGRESLGGEGLTVQLQGSGTSLGQQLGRNFSLLSSRNTCCNSSMSAPAHSCD